MGNPTTARRINEVTVIDKNGNVILEYGSTYATAVTRKNYWDNLQTKLTGDSVLNIGTGNDLQLYHDGSNSYIKDDGTKFNKAGIGFAYDAVRDAFIPPKPYASWKLNETTCQWGAPVAYPDDDKRYDWNEETTTWDEIT